MIVLSSVVGYKAMFVVADMVNFQTDTENVDFDTVNLDSNQPMNCNRSPAISVVCIGQSKTAFCFYC